MDMGGRAADLEINTLFLFLSFFVNGNFATFVLPVIEWGSRRGVGMFFASKVWWGRGGTTVY